MFVDDPDLVHARLENQRVDVVVEFAAIIRLHWQNRKLCAVGSTEVRIHIAVGRKTGTTNINMISMLHFRGGNCDVRFGLGE